VRKTHLSAAFFAVYLLGQIAVPLTNILTGEPNFRWGMFSGSPRADVRAVYPDGAEATLKQIRYRTGKARTLRPHIGARHYPAHLCGLTPRPAEIRIREPGRDREDRYPCPP
jgi:hypothetical protein